MKNLVKLESLPYVALEDKAGLPTIPACYLVVTEEDSYIPIGISVLAGFSTRSRVFSAVGSKVADVIWSTEDVYPLKFSLSNTSRDRRFLIIPNLYPN
jgi:hypothetical protein